MIARALIAAAMLLLGGTSLGCSASAEQLQRLHVTSLTLTTDLPRPAAGQRFHIMIALHVRERSVRAQTVQLPSFNGLEELGDERSSVSGRRGTDYDETLTLLAPNAGRFRVSPALFDAIDAADGKPKRFISNALTIVVGSSLDSRSPIAAPRALLVLALALALPAIAWYFFTRRPAVPQIAPRLHCAPDEPADRRLQDAVLALRERRDRQSALLVRSALRRIAGAGPADTLADILRWPAARDPRLRARLMSAERAAFVQDEHFNEAISRLIAETGTEL